MSGIQNLQTYDPFADTGDQEAGQTTNYIRKSLVSPYSPLPLLSSLLSPTPF